MMMWGFRCEIFGFTFGICVCVLCWGFLLVSLWGVFGSPLPLGHPWCSIPDTAQKLGKKIQLKLKRMNSLVLFMFFSKNVRGAASLY